MPVNPGRRLMPSAPRTAALLILLCLSAGPLVAETFSVNSTGDEPDATASDGQCDTDLDAPEYQCTLRAALQLSNATPGLDEIQSDLPRGTSIAVGATGRGALPAVTDPVVLAGNGLELNGTSAGTEQSGLQLLAGGSTVRDLVINRFGGNGIFITGPGGNLIEGNRIGTDADGTADLGNTGSGIYILDSPDNWIGGMEGSTPGGACSGACNLLSGNQIDGVTIEGDTSTGNRILGNFIGTDVTGTTILAANGSPLGNTRYGVGVRAPGTQIGGVSVAARNVISGNQTDGISIGRATATGNFVRGNFIGTDTTGTRSLGNTGVGVLISYIVGTPNSSASDNLVGGVEGTTPGGPCTGACNLISGNGENGIEIYTGAARNIVQGNFIGTDVTGLLKVDATGKSFGNVLSGVSIGNAPSNQIGNGGAAGRNLISNNHSDGILIFNRLDSAIGGTPGAVASGNRIVGNYIGTGSDGGSDLGNGRMGVLVSSLAGSSGASGNFIGGSGAGQGNVISRNGRDGIQIAQGARNNQVLGNRIGTDESGEAPLGNRRHGVSVFDSPNNRIGAAGAGNIIAANEQHGVLLSIGTLSAGAQNNQVEGNVIGSPGADPDAGDPDPLGNQGYGVVVGSLTATEDSKTTDNTIGGLRSSELCDGPCNVISGNHKDGVVVSGKGTVRNFVQGNYIGLRQDGTGARPNGGSGVLVKDGAAQNTVGGARDTVACSGPCNVISGNREAGVGLMGQGTSDNHVEGNYIGVGPDGIAPVPNGAQGVYVADRSPRVPNAKVAYAVESHYSQTEWPTGVDVEQTACMLKGKHPDPGAVEGLVQSVKGFLFEILVVHQEKHLKRSPSPQEPAYDGTDSKRRRWQIKAYAIDSSSTACSEILGLFPVEKEEFNLNNDIWGLALPRGTEPQPCNSANQTRLDARRADARLFNSKLYEESPLRQRVVKFFDYARDKTDCPPAATTGAPATRNVIGGERGSTLCDGVCNVIGWNLEAGVLLNGANATGNLVQGNFIGASPLSPLPVPNLYGVQILGSPANTVGGERGSTACDGRCNMISGNELEGVSISGAASSGNTILGNYIGLNPSGTSALPNGAAGVLVEMGAFLNTIGGLRPGQACNGPCNVISGNGTDGVLLWGAGTAGNSVQGNYIGVSPDGATRRGNALSGVSVQEGASPTTIGSSQTPAPGACVGACNLIRGNGGAGVSVLGDLTAGVTIRGNSLFGNGGLPIDLGDDGPTPNDYGDSDIGPNGLLNSPELEVRFEGSTTTLHGSIRTPNPELTTIDVYRGDEADPARFLQSVVPDPGGEFMVVVSGTVPVWSAITQGSDGSTSELAALGRRPLIFIPGLAGSRLTDTASGAELWPSLGNYQRLSLYPGEELSGIVATDAVRYFTRNLKLGKVYGPLLELLTDPARGGYREYQVDGQPARRTGEGCDVMGQKANAPNLFVFAYDWRKPIEDNALVLRRYLDCIQRFHPDSEVDILAHSAGGLLARSYILLHREQQPKVHHLLTIASPWLGTPQPIHILQTGDWHFLLPRETVRHIAGSFPGLHQMLPGGFYYAQVDGDPPSPDKLFPLVEDGWDFNGNGKDVEVYDFRQYVEALDDHYGRFQPPSGSTAELFHIRDQDDWSADPPDIQVSHLIGTQRTEATIGQLSATYQLSCQDLASTPVVCPFRKQVLLPIWTRGDGTVTRLSAERPGYDAPDTTRLEFFGSGDAEHLSLTQNPLIQETIIHLLSQDSASGAAPLQAPGDVPASEEPPPPELSFYLTLDGATQVTVHDEAGHSTDDVPGTFGGDLPEVGMYVLADNLHMLTIPLERSYLVTFRTTAEPLGVELIIGTGSTATEVIRYSRLPSPDLVGTLLLKLPPTPNLRAGTAASVASPAVELRFDSDGDGIFETLVPPTVSVSGPAANDLEPPRLTAEPSLQPTPGGLRLRVALTAEDGGSGVKALYSSLDGTNYHPYSGPVDIDPVQSPVLYAFADDHLMNRRVLVYPLPVTDLAVSLAASPDRVAVGSDLTYALTVANQGAQTTRDVTVQIALPAGVRVLSCTAPGGTCGGSEGAPVVTFPSLATGGTAGATLAARVDCSFSDGAPIAATASVSSALFDRNAGNDTATANATALNPIAISPTEQSFPPGGGSGGLDVSAPAACGWTAVSQAPFLTVVSGASGTGNGWVSFTVEANPDTAPRTGTLLVAGRTFTVTQEGCSYTLSSTSQSFPARGGTGSFQVTAPAGCAWAATSDDAFVTVGTSGNGDGTVEYSVAANPDRSPRTGSIHLADQTFTVSQEGVPCAMTITLAPSAQGPVPGEQPEQLEERAALLLQRFFGGAGFEKAYAVAVDAAGDLYITGETDSSASSFPVSVGPDLTFNGGASDAFVAKIRGDGSGVVYAGYIGGGSTDVGLGIAVDTAGNAYVTGYTYGGFFHIPSDSGLVQSGLSDAFVAKINPAGTAFLYLGFIGGQSYDNGLAIAVDAAGNAYVTGHTYTPEAYGFPVRTGPDLTFNGPLGGRDAFVAKVRADGRALDYAGYLGGDNEDGGSGIAVDAAGSAYVTGSTKSRETTFPVVGGPDLTFNGSTTLPDAFVAKVKPDGTELEYCGYLGGSESDIGEAIAVDASGSAYVTGGTYSGEDTFPVVLGPGLSYQGGPLSPADAFVAKVAPNGLSLSYCGYLGGGNLSDEGRGIAVDAAGNAYVTGYTAGGFPALGGLDSTPNGNGDAFVAKVNVEGTGLIYGGYVGGTGIDQGEDIALNGAGTAYVGGYTNSTANGSFDAFLAGIRTEPGLALFLTSSPYAVIAGNQLTYKITVTNDSGQIEEDVEVTDDLPAELTLISASATGGGILGGSGNHVTVRFPSLALGASASVTLVTQVSCSAANFSSLTNMATVTSSASGPVSSNTLVTPLSNPAALSPASQSFPPEAGSGQVAVTMPPACDWTAVSDAPWLRITSGGSGRGNGTVLFTVDANGSAARTGTIRVGGKTLTVLQTGTGSACLSTWAHLTPSATLNGTLTTDDCQSPIRPGYYADRYWLGTGWQAELTVALASPDFDTWFFLIDPSGAIVGQGTGREGGFFNLTDTAGRPFTLEVTSASPGQTGSYTLALEDRMACNSIWTHTPFPSSFPAAGGAGGVRAIAGDGCLWTVASDVPWLSTQVSGGQGEQRISFTVAPNPTTSARTGTLIFTLAARNISATATVTQEAAPPLTTSFPAAGGTGEVRVSTDGDCPWTAVSNDPWITVLSGGQGSGNGSVTYAVGPNPDASPRTGSLSIAGGTLIVHQEPAGAAGADFYTVPPCRIADTRGPAGPYGGPALTGGGTRSFQVSGQCGIPASAKAVALNVTAVEATFAGYLTLYPQDATRPVTSTINFSPGQVRANNAIVKLGNQGELSVFSGQPGGNTVHVVLDVTGYFE